MADLQWEHEGNREYTNSVYRTLLERIAEFPGVAMVSMSGWSYFGENSRRASIISENQPGRDVDENPLCEFLSVGPGFFQTMGVPLLRGREFTA